MEGGRSLACECLWFVFAIGTLSEKISFDPAALENLNGRVCARVATGIKRRVYDRIGSITLRGGCSRISSIGNMDQFWDHVMSRFFSQFLS